MHKAQLSILYSLRHRPAMSFSELMRPTGQTSDNFKFHVHKLQKLGHIEKSKDGYYQLTARGKEFANNLDRKTRNIQKQPKLSVLMVVSRKNETGPTGYLLQKRLRSPYRGYWGFLSGPARWGETFEQTASAELAKQTGLTADFAVAGFCRVNDYLSGESLAEDKLFAVVSTESTEHPHNDWPGGHNQWMSLVELEAQEKIFTDTYNALDIVANNRFYIAQDVVYDGNDY